MDKINRVDMVCVSMMTHSFIYSFFLVLLKSNWPLTRSDQWITDQTSASFIEQDE